MIVSKWDRTESTSDNTVVQQCAKYAGAMIMRLVYRRGLEILCIDRGRGRLRVV